ncbi:MAG: hypothetical protein GY750_20990 [Lentisphaerae bacterium]|nr:hypothetical protein [Lentisphaerota bacterium]
MSFGIATAGVLSRQTSATTQTADKLNEAGNILESTSFGATVEVTEETYTDTFTNMAVNSQNGASIVTSHDYNEVNNDYAKETKTTRSVVVPS